MEKLLQILREIDDEIDYENENALVDDELLDSLQLLKIIAAMDSAYGIHIRAGEIEPENFNSVTAMMKLIESYKEKPQ